MQPSEIISLVKLGQTPGNSDLKKFCSGLADGSVSDAQAAAFAMAVCLKGLDIQGRKDLTLSMRDSGEILSWDLGGPVLDKHSTGTRRLCFFGLGSLACCIWHLCPYDFRSWVGSYRWYTG